MEPQTQEQQTKPTKILVGVLLGVVFVGLIGYVILSVNQRGTTKQGVTTKVIITVAPTPTPTPLPYPTKGKMKLQTKNNATTFSVNTPIEITFTASSDNEKIVGYDVVLSYDTTSFQRGEIQNNDETFKVFTYEREGRVLVSAVKDLQAIETSAWEDHSLFTYTFTPQKKGTFTFSLKPFGQETSKLVNEKAEAAYTDYQDLQLEIQ